MLDKIENKEAFYYAFMSSLLKQVKNFLSGLCILHILQIWFWCGL